MPARCPIHEVAYRTIQRNLTTYVSFCLALIAFASISNNAMAQKVRVEAVTGLPFGVGRVVVPFNGRADLETLETRLMSISEASGRVHYPALRYTQPLGMVRDLLGMPEQKTPSELHIHFLFTGSEPLDLKLNIPEHKYVTVHPKARRFAYNRLLRLWWQRYNAAARKQRNEGDYSPIIETYLTSMLSRRLGLEDKTLTLQNNGESLAMLLGTEKIRLAMLQESTHGRHNRLAPLSRQMPEAIKWPDFAFPDSLTAGQQKKLADGVEPMANHVPQECFYIRFAQFPNYLWLRRLLEEYGGDLSRMVLLRGTDSPVNKRVEDQLGLRESSLSSLLGPQVISDVAMIGRDTYMREGAAIGILFEAKNNLIRSDLMGQRQKRVDAMKELGASMKEIELGGQKVSVASTPDNRLRSFYAQSGKYHLVTNCQEIARRFLECRETETALGDTDEFRYARNVIPTGEDNTVFVYLSRKFFQGLLSPQYQIELPRRLRSVTDSELMELATLAAVSEGHGRQPITMDRLVELGFLPNAINRRSDGSTTKIVNSRTLDSIRGRRGSFLPIPDTPIDAISEQEWIQFERTRTFHQRHWSTLDPVLIGLRRTAIDDETERVEIQARMLPINNEKYGTYTQIFGPPNTQRIRPPEDDIVSVQAYVDGTDIGWNIPPHHLYFGIRDAAPKKEFSNRRFLKSLQVMRTAPAYVAAWPKPGFLESLGLVGRQTPDGYSKMLLGLYRLDALNGFSLLSFDKQILGEVAPVLDVEETDENAQLRIVVGDIMNSKFGQWANDLDYQRAWETSVGNVRLLHVMTQQLHVPMAKAKEAIERALDTHLLCPLGGEYQLYQNPDGTERWASSAWVDGKEAHRDEYVSPLMHWLRGMEASVSVNENRIVAEGFLKIKREKQAEKGGIKLPIFNLFGGSASTKKATPTAPVGDQRSREEVQRNTANDNDQGTKSATESAAKAEATNGADDEKDSSKTSDASESKPTSALGSILRGFGLTGGSKETKKSESPDDSPQSQSKTEPDAKTDNGTGDASDQNTNDTSAEDSDAAEELPLPQIIDGKAA